jgi:uncharacterized MAPEG superfamily protein
MKVPFVCLSLVLLLPYLLASYGAYYRKKSLGMIDKDNPRAQAARLDAYGARIYASQQNAWEAATLFSASVLAAKVVGVSVNQMTAPARCSSLSEFCTRSPTSKAGRIFDPRYPARDCLAARGCW